MEKNDFDRYSELWKKVENTAYSHEEYSKESINKLKMKKSNDLTKSIQRSISFDLVLKSVLILAMILLALIFKTDTNMNLGLFGVAGILGILIYHERLTREQLQALDEYSREVKSVLTDKLRFYRNDFSRLSWMFAISNGAFVWVGSLFYYYWKYGMYKITSFMDVLVSAMMIIIAFGISYFAMLWQLKYVIHELEENLASIDEDKAFLKVAEKHKKQRIIITISAIITLIIGLLLFFILLNK